MLEFVLDDGKSMTFEESMMCEDAMTVKLWSEDGKYIREASLDIDTINEMLFSE